MVFYRNLVDAALDIAPNATMQAIAREVINFQMPGSTMPGFAENALAIAKAGIYDLRSHLDDVVRPVLRFWRVFERDNLDGAGARARDELRGIPRSGRGEGLVLRPTSRTTAGQRGRACGSLSADPAGWSSEWDHWSVGPP